jgi:hypothetical protein
MSTPKPNATPAEMASLAKLNERLYGTKPEVGVAKPMKPSPINQRNYDRLTAMAQKGPLSQTNQRNLDYAAKRLGPRQPQTPPNVKPPMPQPTGNFQGDTRVPNVNTIGAPMPPMPGANIMGGGTPPVTTNFKPGMGGNIGGSAAGTPAGMNMRTMKKGGKVKQMASGGMTSKTSSASKRADGIAQRGKTKGRMC